MRPIAGGSVGYSVGEHVFSEPHLGQIQSQLDGFVAQENPLQLLVCEHEMSRQILLDAWLSSRKAHHHDLVLTAHLTLTPKDFLLLLANHHGMSLPGFSTGFRDSLAAFLTVFKEKKESALLVVRDAHRLPIAILAALMHLAFLQEAGAGEFKILLVGDPVCTKNIKVFRPDGVREITLLKNDVAFTCLQLQGILAQRDTSLEFPPKEVVDLIHWYARGEKSAMESVLDDWYASSEEYDDIKNLKKSIKGRSRSLGQIPINKTMGGLLRKSCTTSFVMMLAITVGVASHVTVNQRNALPAESGQYYGLRLMETPDRIQALKWVAHHPGLPKAEVKREKKSAQDSRFHIEYGRYDSIGSVKQAYEQAQGDYPMENVEIVVHKATKWNRRLTRWV